MKISALLVSIFACALEPADSQSRLPLIPYPAHVELDANAPSLALAENVAIQVNGLNATDVACQVLKGHIAKVREAVGGSASAVAGGGGGHRGVSKGLKIRSSGMVPQMIQGIDLVVTPSSSQSAESYKLHISKAHISIEAPAAAGIFYGVQTLRQLTDWEGSPKFPQVSIQDAPRFSWRGLHLDVSRHFFDAEEVKHLLDVMAMFKLNRFHWHLTDDQGWRLPVEGYPKLTEIGAQSVDGQRHSYTIGEIRDVVAYAHARHIEVVPEVDVPGHTSAALAAYPELGNRDVPGWTDLAAPERTWGMHQHTLAPTDATTKFLNKVFYTLSDLFPATWIHMGGDEAPTAEWELSRQARRASGQLVGLPPHWLQKYFNTEVAGIIESRHRNVIGWDETQHIGGLPSDAVIMAWRSKNEAYQAAITGHQVINADNGHYYFDHTNDPLESVYNYDPMPDDIGPMDATQRARVLGGQGELWSEHFPDIRKVEYEAFPKSMALAERLWTPKEGILGFSDFSSRLPPRLKDLDEMRVNYKSPTPNILLQNMQSIDEALLQIAPPHHKQRFRLNPGR